ncbi:sterigmatocystin 8-O-methyltransferase [Xylariaceae sp. AK1471]|nr:sterigmatocystin 8-O-methyltransferase [Xylariaceae sp. AK1471]
MASPNTTPRIVELAAKISASVTELQGHLLAQGVPSPSFAEDSPERLPPNTFHLQDAVLDATAELHELLMEPIPLIFKFSATTNMVGIDAICRFHFADIVPSGGQVSFTEIAKSTGLDEQLVTRLLRHAMSMHIFKEPEPGMVAHTNISKYFTLPYVNDWLSFGAREGWPAATRMLDAIQKWPSSEESNNTGFSLVNNTDKSIFEVLSADHARAMRLASAVKAHNHFPGYAATDVPKLYDWASLGNAFVIHVGGQRGEIAIELAKSFGELELLVQDMEMVVAGAEAGVPDELKRRIEFKPHELFEAQSVQADIYLFRLIFQVWTDKYAVQILKAQIPALQPGAKLLIQDLVMPEPSDIPLWRDRELRSMDLNAGASFNGRNRYLHEWKALLAAADERFCLQRVIAPGRSLLSTLEIVWDAPGSAKA